ncbi:N-alpha-acetyltransferase 40 [Aricia agestis]|uniref:N-alpha-acetyltransferase 40 n=1 Tax=Aricia agestis TaxID=91739 RepID=UPI001C202A6E|nr:N-alpha-acetyltransferase 40 [Aricia agestis]
MGKNNTDSANKNKEKRLARKLEQRRIADGMKFVGSANKLKDLNTLCTDYLMYNNNSLEINLYIRKVTELEKTILDWAIDLTERNMKKLYETCVWGWNKNKKVEELTEHDAWYLIAKDKDEKLQAFSHFRFDMDYGDPVLYCYEVQIEAEGRRKGLGQRLMLVLESIAQKTHMKCVRLTVLTHNPAATAFFRACGYTLDESSPDKEETNQYEILSKSTSPQESAKTGENQITPSEVSTKS